MGPARPSPAPPGSAGRSHRAGPTGITQERGIPPHHNYHFYYFYYFNDEYGVASTRDGGALVEGDSFENADEPTLVGPADSPGGAVMQHDNVFAGSGTPEGGGGSVGSIPYSYTLDNPNSVRSIVTTGAATGRI